MRIRALILLLLIFSAVQSQTTTIQQPCPTSGGQTTLIDYTLSGGIGNGQTTRIGIRSCYDPLTIAYKQRVEADGGIISDLTYTDSIVKYMRFINVLDSGKVGLSARMGVKLTGSNPTKVLKRYNLFDNTGLTDEIQANSDSQYVYSPFSCVDAKPIVCLRYAKAYIPSIKLPTYTDTYVTGIKFKGTMANFFIEHSPNAVSNPGMWAFGYQYSWLVNRGGVTHFETRAAEWAYAPYSAHVIYNDSFQRSYLNHSVLSAGTNNGVLKSNSVVTARLNLFGRGATYVAISYAYNRDVFMFGKLRTDRSYALDGWFYNHYFVNQCQKDSISFLVDGDSQNTGAAGASISWPVILHYSMSSVAGLVNNSSLGGQISAQVLANVQTHLDANYYPTYRNNIFVLWVGVNDITLGITPDSTYRNIKSIVSKSNTKGFRTYVMTNRDIYVIDTSATRYAKLIALNDSIRRGASLYNYEVVEVANDSKWNYRTAYNDLNYYTPDKVHLSDYAHYWVGHLVWEAIKNEIK